MSRVSRQPAAPQSRFSPVQAIIIGVIAVIAVGFSAWYFLSGPSRSAPGSAEQLRNQQQQSLRGMGAK